MALAKVRALHPDFFSDEAVAEVSIPARLLFAGLWCFACDNGHLADKPKQIKRWIYATDDVNAAELLRELEAEELIERADGWIFIPRLVKRQRIDHRYFKACEKDGCEKPKKPDSQPETRSDNGGATQSHAVTTRGPATDGDGDGDGDVTTTALDAANDLDGFDEFWDIYAKKVGRKKAEQKWRLAVKKRDVTPSVLIRAATNYVNSQMAAGKHPEFTKDPATWLNGEHWTDEAPNNVHQLRVDDQGRPVLPPLPSRSPWGN